MNAFQQFPFFRPLSIAVFLFLSVKAFAGSPVENWSAPALPDRQAMHVFSNVAEQDAGLSYMPRNYSKRISGNGYEYRFECRASSKTYPIYGGTARLDLTVPLGGLDVETDVTRSKIIKPVSVSNSPTFRSASINPNTVPVHLKQRRMTFRRML